jgi:hypothetical protein
VTVSYVCIRPFKARIAVSGREREFKPGDRFCRQIDEVQQAETITLEADGSYFLAERIIVDACCRAENETPPF